MEIFSITSFLIVLRESIEAALIVGILLAYLNKTEKQRYRRDIWLGTILAIISSIFGSVLLIKVLGEFEGDFEVLFEGIVLILAAFVLSWMIIWMRKNAKFIKHELQDKMDTAINQNRRFALMGIAFIAVFKEGIETILIIGAISANETIASVIIGSVMGFTVAAFMAYALFGLGIRLDIQQFFSSTSFILIIFAAGLFTMGVHEFQELGLFGAESFNWNTPFLDLSDKLNDKFPSAENPNGSVIGAMLRALFGYQDKPTLIELMSYVMYWVGILGISSRINSKFEITKEQIISV